MTSYQWKNLWIAWTLCAAVALSQPCRADHKDREPNEDGSRSTRLFFRFEGTTAFVGKLIAGTNPFATRAYGFRFGIRPNRWDFFIYGEHGVWGTDTVGEELVNSTFNGGIGVGFSYFNNLMRTSLSMGPSILLTESFQNSPGTTGIFVDARPIGFRFPVSKWFTIEFHPLTFSWVMPVWVRVPLVYINYRTSIGIEFGF